MKKRFVAAAGRMYEGSASSLIACVTAFISGCVIGTVFSGMVFNTGTLSNYFSHFFEMYASGEVLSAGLWSVLFNTYIYHVIVFLCGFSIIGALIIPIIASVRGFSLAFSIAALIRLYSGGGVGVALSAFGLTAVIAVPCFLIIAVFSFEASRRLFMAAFSRSTALEPVYTGRFFLVCTVCLALLIVPVFLDLLLVPKLLRAAILHM